MGYIEPKKFEGMTEDDQHAMLDECFEDNDHLRANGHVVAEVTLQPPETAVTLYWENGKAATAYGPYAETDGHLGGLQILEARDLNHAISASVAASRQGLWNYGDTAGCGFDRTDERERGAATTKECLAMRAATNSLKRERLMLGARTSPSATLRAMGAEFQGKIIEPNRPKSR